MVCGCTGGAFTKLWLETPEWAGGEMSRTRNIPWTRTKAEVPRYFPEIWSLLSLCSSPLWIQDSRSVTAVSGTATRLQSSMNYPVAWSMGTALGKPQLKLIHSFTHLTLKHIQKHFFKTKNKFSDDIYRCRPELKKVNSDNSAESYFLSDCLPKGELLFSSVE